MALSEYWEKFIEEYAADNIYWYFPKGGTADTDEFREKFRVFQSFEGEEWTPELHGPLPDGAVRRRTFCRPDPRTHPHYEAGLQNLGLCWVDGQPANPHRRCQPAAST